MLQLFVAADDWGEQRSIYTGGDFVHWTRQHADS